MTIYYDNVYISGAPELENLNCQLDCIKMIAASDITRVNTANSKIFCKFPIDDVSNWDCFTKKFFVLDLQRSLKKYDRSNNYIGGRDIKLKGKKQSKFLKKEN